MDAVFISTHCHAIQLVRHLVNTVLELEIIIHVHRVFVHVFSHLGDWQYVKCVRVRACTYSHKHPLTQHLVTPCSSVC